MASFYNTVCNVDAKMALFQPKLQKSVIDDGLTYYVPDSKDDGELVMPQSIMNDNVAINYRTIYNGYPTFEKYADFTAYDDYRRCMEAEKTYISYLQDKQNPTYKNILKYYSDKTFDPYGLANYRMQDFIYLKYYNQIPNNYMVTLRRYTLPCEDHMFGLDMTAAKAAFAEYLNDVNLDADQIYFANQIIEYIVRNGVMKDMTVLQEPPFTDRGSIVQVFTDLTVWLGIKAVIDRINANAAA